MSEEPVSRFYGTLRKVTRHGGHFKIADPWKFEAVNNPDAALGNPLIDSNPVDVWADHGRFFIADAGGNTVLRKTWWSGLVAGGDLRQPHPSRTRSAGRTRDIPMQAVPTASSRAPTARCT